MREILSFHIGQAGVQIGNAVWELMCLEHCLSEDGTSYMKSEESHNDIFFQQINDNIFVPRSLFIDLEPTVIDEIRHGAFKKLFHPDRLISGPEDAAGNFARGFFTVGKLVLSNVDIQVRKLFESSGCVQAIILYRSLGGGTGAGLTSAMFEGLSEYPKTPKIEMSLYPSASLAPCIVEPYNTLLAEHFCMEDIGLGMLVDNESLYDIATGFLDNGLPTFAGINRIISQIISNITASVRFQSISACDVTLIQSNLVPFPRIHHPLCNVSPLLAHNTSAHENVTIKDITQMLFTRENQLLKIDTFLGKYISCVLCYRGNINICNVYEALTEIKRNKSIQFVDWCPTGFKVGISLTPPVQIPGGYIADTDKNVVMLTNTSAIGQAWQRLTHKFYMLYSKRAFIHWFVGEGMEECEFTESLYNISSLVKDYEEITVPTDLLPSIPAPKEKVSMAAMPKTVTIESKETEPDLFVTMANGYAVSAPDRGSLAQKSSLVKSGYVKNSAAAAEIANALKDIKPEASKLLYSVYEEDKQVVSEDVNSEQSPEVKYLNSDDQVDMDMNQDEVQNDLESVDYKKMISDEAEAKGEQNYEDNLNTAEDEVNVDQENIDDGEYNEYQEDGEDAEYNDDQEHGEDEEYDDEVPGNEDQEQEMLEYGEADEEEAETSFDQI